jgi:hypothetical protein
MIDGRPAPPSFPERFDVLRLAVGQTARLTGAGSSASSSPPRSGG